MGGQTLQPTAESCTVTAASSGAGVSSSASVAVAGNLDLANGSANSSGSLPVTSSAVAQHADLDVAAIPAASLVDVSDPRLAMPEGQANLTENSNFRFSNSSGQEPAPLQHTEPSSNLQPRGDTTQNSTLITVGKPGQEGLVPTSHSPPAPCAAENGTVPMSQAESAPGHHLERGAIHLPPLRSPPQIPPRPWVVQATSGSSSSVNRVKSAGGVCVLPTNGKQLPYPTPPPQQTSVTTQLSAQAPLPSLVRKRLISGEIRINCILCMQLSVRIL